MLKKIIKNSLPYSFVCAMQQESRKETHINRAIQAIKANTYVEIGVAEGACFLQIKAPQKIGIDPAPAGSGNNLDARSALFNMTSDEFFREKAAELFQSNTIDVALVDGFHEFGQALRDVLNLERYMSRAGVIFLHDCNPLTPEQAGDTESKFWTGDVWKVAYYVKKYRQDLSYFTLDCDWGVGVYTGFNDLPGRDLSSSPVLEECKSLDYDYLRANRNQLLRLRNCYFSKYFFWKLHVMAQRQSKTTRLSN